jgi:hypothetical protein
MGPLSQPPLNSVPSSPRNLPNVTAAHRTMLATCANQRTVMVPETPAWL